MTDAAQIMTPAESNKKLFEAIKAGNLAEVQNCVFWGADLTERDSRFRTPLLLASCLNKTDIAAYLIEQNASVIAQDDNNNAPLHYVVTHSNIALIKKLLPLIGAKINLVNNSLDTAFNLAIYNCAYEVIRIMLSSKDITIFSVKVIRFVASSDNLPILNMLLDADPFLEINSTYYRHALEAACEKDENSLCALRLLSAMPFKRVIDYQKLNNLTLLLGHDPLLFSQLGSTIICKPAENCVLLVMEMQDNIIKALLLGRRYKALQYVHGVIKNILYLMAPEWYVHRLEKDFRVLSTRFNKIVKQREARTVERFNYLVSKIKVPSPTLGFSPNAKQCMKNIPKQPLLIEYPKKTTDITEITRNIATLRLH